jgi:hypothetical protein
MKIKRISREEKKHGGKAKQNTFIQNTYFLLDLFFDPLIFQEPVV